MAGSQVNGAAGHFGRQMKKERLARGWSLMELAQRMGVDAAHLGRVESGKRPPTENLAAKCDAVFTERQGWFSEFYDESRHVARGAGVVQVMAGVRRQGARTARLVAVDRDWASAD